jgi:hypothetical protein
MVTEHQDTWTNLPHMKMSPNYQVERHIPLPEQLSLACEILIVLLVCYQCSMTLKSDIRACV